MTAAQQKGTRASYQLSLHTKDGRKLTLADAIDNRQEARWVAAQLEKLAGLKLDTHVVVTAGFGAYGPPPQRGQASSASSASFRGNRPLTIAVGLAFFFAWTGFIGYHILSHGHTQPKHVLKACTGPELLCGR